MLVANSFAAFISNRAEPDWGGGDGDKRTPDERATANFCCFNRGTFWVLPLAYFYLPNLSKLTHYFCSGPMSVDPIRRQPTAPGTCPIVGDEPRVRETCALSAQGQECGGQGELNLHIYIYIYDYHVIVIYNNLHLHIIHNHKTCTIRSGRSWVSPPPSSLDVPPGALAGPGFGFGLASGTC